MMFRVIFAMKKKIRSSLQYVQWMRAARLPAIFLYASRRGAGTMVMQALAESTRSRYVDQPFSLYSAENEVHMQSIPFAVKSEMVALDRDDEEKLFSFCNSLVSGETAYNSSTRPWRKEFHFLSDRVLLKITNAKSYVTKFDDWFRPVNIILLRNPVSVAKSCINNEWGLTTHAFLGNRYFCRDVLSESLLKFCDHVESNGTLLERHVLNWCLDHYVCIKNSPKNAVIIRYEDLVSDSHSVVARLKEVIPELSEERFLASLERPSKSSRYSQHLRETKKVDSAVIGSIVDPKLPEADLLGVKNIISEFGVYDEYY